MKWGLYERLGGFCFELLKAPNKLPWKCSIRFSELSQNCSCPRFEDNSCVPPHLKEEFFKLRDKAYEAKKLSPNGTWEVDRSFSNINFWSWQGNKNV